MKKCLNPKVIVKGVVTVRDTVNVSAVSRALVP